MQLHGRSWNAADDLAIVFCSWNQEYRKTADPAIELRSQL
jgi:hypothetical protein